MRPEILVECLICGTSLDIEKTESGKYGDFTVKVKPCEKCLEDAATEAESGYLP